MSVERHAGGWIGATRPPSRAVLVRPRRQIRTWLWAWAIWLLVAAAVPPLGLLLGAVLALAHKALGAAMFAVATISGVWMAAAYVSR